MSIQDKADEYSRCRKAEWDAGVRYDIASQEFDAARTALSRARDAALKAADDLLKSASPDMAEA